jgi:hypothetical protein
MMRRIMITVLALWCIAVGARGSEPGERTNKELFEEACRIACSDLGTKCRLTPSSSVLVKFTGGERTEFFRSSLMDALRSACRAVYTSGTTADTLVTLGISDAGVLYGPAFREGWFRGRKTERIVRLDVRMEASSVSSGKILFAETLRRSVRDTIAVDDIADLGASARPIAVGEPPGPSLWERLLEPAILTVSTGIAVYLFFTVRS